MKFELKLVSKKWFLTTSNLLILLKLNVQSKKLFSAANYFAIKCTQILCSHSCSIQNNFRMKKSVFRRILS